MTKGIDSVNTYASDQRVVLPPGTLEPVDEVPGDSDIDDEDSHYSNSSDNEALSKIDEDDEELYNQTSLCPDPVFEKIKASVTRTLQRSESIQSNLSSLSAGSDEGPHVQISEQYTSLPYGIQPRATYEHAKTNTDIMGVAYNNRMRQFVILDSKGITTWKRDMVDQRVRRALQYPKYEYRLITHIVYAPKYNCYFALGKDFSLKVLNREFEETCSVHANLRSVLFMLFNPVRDELITGGVGGIQVWTFCQVAGRAFQELKQLANYELKMKYELPDVGGSWVKRVDLDHYLQHLYCCSDTDLHVYNLQGKLLFKFERAHTMSITGCCYSPSHKVLVTSSVDSEVKVWSVTGGLVHTFRGHSRAVTSLLLHPETSAILITSSLDGSIRMWSLDTMDLLYMLVVSADGVLWMGLTDDRLLYISTCRNISLWALNSFYSFWGLARNPVTKLCLAGCEDKTTRVVCVGEDSSVRLFLRCNQKNITTVLPPPDISPLQKVLSVCYSREFNVAFLLVNNKEIWVYTTRTDPSCRIAKWDVHEVQLPYMRKESTADPQVLPAVTTQTMQGVIHRATENGTGTETVSNCSSLCILNSMAMMWTDEGFCCPIRHTYLLLGLEDGRILFMDPVVKGKKYMEFKASKDPIQEMKHDTSHSSLITLSHLKQLVLLQIWGLPQLDLMYELYCALDITAYARMGLTFMTGHETGSLILSYLEPAVDLGVVKAKLEPEFGDVVDKDRRPEHNASIVAIDSITTLRVYCTCSSDGAIKIWDENKILMTEVMLEESLSAACFLNDLGDLLVGFKNHIFFIDHSRLIPQIKPPDIEMETSDQESDVFEDPSVLYEGGLPDEEPVTLENYLVPYDIEFSKDFLEGNVKIEHKKAKTEEIESETSSELSMAPTDLYYSPPDSPFALEMIDLTLGADYSKYDLYKQMESTIDHLYRVQQEKKQKPKPFVRRWLRALRGRKKRWPRKRKKQVTIDSGMSDREEADIEIEKLKLPAFGNSPGGTPSVTPPTAPASPTEMALLPEQIPFDDEDRIVKKPKGFRPVEPARGKSPYLDPAGEFDDQLSERTITPEELIPFESTSHKSFRSSPRTVTPEDFTPFESSPVDKCHRLSPRLSPRTITHENLTTNEPSQLDKSRPLSQISITLEHLAPAESLPVGQTPGQSTNQSPPKTPPYLEGPSESPKPETEIPPKPPHPEESAKIPEAEIEIPLKTPPHLKESTESSMVEMEIPQVCEELPTKELDRDPKEIDTKETEVLSVSEDVPEVVLSPVDKEEVVQRQKLARPVAVMADEYEDEPEEKTAEGQKKYGLKGVKVDVRGLLKAEKKKRVTSGKAPSMTRRPSTDHSHPDDHHHADQKMSKKQLKKQQQLLLDRKVPPKGKQLLVMNPPSMLERARRPSHDKRLLDPHHLMDPLRRHSQESHPDEMPGHSLIKFDIDHDLDDMQDKLWEQEASALMGTKLTLPEPKLLSKAKVTAKPDAKGKQRHRTNMFGEVPMDTHVPGVGESPTAELEKDDGTEADKEVKPLFSDKKSEHEELPERPDTAISSDFPGRDSDKGSVVNVDTNVPETQVERHSRLGSKTPEDKMWHHAKSEAYALSRRSKLSVYLPTAERDTPTIDTLSSYRGTPDSGITLEETAPLFQPSFRQVDELGEEADDEAETERNGMLLSEKDKAKAIKRPASSFTGLRRGQLEGEKLMAERPRTAHVRFRAETLTESPKTVKDLQAVFDEALQRYQNLPGTPAMISADKLYKNDGVTFEDNWQERIIERHLLLRMKKEIRSQSAARKRQVYEDMLNAKRKNIYGYGDSDSGVEQSMSDISGELRRCQTAMSMASVPSPRPSTQRSPQKPRPKTAAPPTQIQSQKQLAKQSLSAEKAFRFRLNHQDPPPTPRPSSTRSSARSRSSLADFQSHWVDPQALDFQATWIDPRNPSSLRPKSTRSIPSKCHRYVLVNSKPKRSEKPLPSPLEEQLIAERFPKMGMQVFNRMVTPTPRQRVKSPLNMQYSPFVYQRHN